MNSSIRDNHNYGAVGDFLKSIIIDNSKLSIVSAYFTIYAYRRSSAEVDYVVAVDSLILPVEVKAGKTGTLKSLKLFIEEKKALFSIRFSQEKLSLYDKVLTLPLYMAEQMRKLVQEAENSI